jgi:hypothetical protein
LQETRIESEVRRMIIVDDRCQEHFDKVVAEAGKMGLADKLWRSLEYLSGYGCQNDPSERAVGCSTIGRRCRSRLRWRS